MKTPLFLTATILFAMLLATGNGAIAQQESQEPTGGHEQQPKVITKIPYLGTIRIVKPGRGGNPQPLVTTCAAGTGESCALFASNCLVAGGYYDGDNSGGTCCSGVDHPNSNPNSACN